MAIESPNSASRSNSIRGFALQARLFIALLQIFFNYLIPDHDAKVFDPPIGHRTNTFDNWVTHLFGGFRRWDGIYFLHVAEYGYTYENALAFFPLFPLLTRLTANTILIPLQFIMNYSSCLLVAAFLVNLVLFVLSADILYRLGIKVMGSDVLAFKAAQLYCMNPGSIFFSAPYSETTFALFSFSGMLSLEHGSLPLASLLFGISSMARSNGLVNCAFVLYKITKDFHMIVFLRSYNFYQNRLASAVLIMSAIFMSFCKIVISVLLCWSPFLAYQYYAYRIFCNPLASYLDLPAHVLNYGNNQRYKMSHTGLSKWCHQSVPLSYSYVQQMHWNVGLFNYYDYKQIPNFLLALPMMILCICTIIHYLIQNPVYCLSLGFYDPVVRLDKKIDDEPQAKVSQSLGVNRKSCLTYIIHLAFLTITGILFMHVQVLTRFIASSCPVIYWFIASKMVPDDDTQQKTRPETISNGVNESNSCPVSSDSSSRPDIDMMWNDSSWFGRIVLVYFHLYLFVGVAAFSNFLPWT